ncbi:MAG TPA: hypothetical protein VG819_10520 [Rhizomicrobium sp.]|jgi:hypothetical protein|nr:hypothetical protein [Rhizomicrobium sp.]
MWEICITIHGVRHCFVIPLLVEKFHIPGPGPVNYPELELAVSVLQLIEHIRPNVKQAEFTDRLADVARGFIQQVQKGMPQGVELRQMAAR